MTPGRLRNLSLGHLVNQHLEIDENLAADFDGSFSGLGVDINASNYSMSDALMALPNLSISTSQIFKQEAISPAALAATVNAAGVATYPLLFTLLSSTVVHRFSGKFEKIAATKCGFVALQNLDLHSFSIIRVSSYKGH